jgi:hypothetical protein
MVLVSMDQFSSKSLGNPLWQKVTFTQKLEADRERWFLTIYRDSAWDSALFPFSSGLLSPLIRQLQSDRCRLVAR